MTDWLKGLNEEQRHAVLHDFGPLLILAGAGSGKTTVLVARSGRLLQDKVVKASELCVLTFTNKAARELKARVANRLGDQASQIWAGTFHSFGLRLLRKFHRQAGLSREFGILDPGDAGPLCKELLRDWNNAGKTAYDSDRLLSKISQWRETGQTRATKEEEYDEAVEWLLPRYLRRLETLGMVDFDGLILKPIELLQSNDKARDQVQGLFRQVMVDEFQDTNQMQMKLIRLLTDSHLNLSVVGDDDQSIYGWRGACISNILNFPKLFRECKVVRLERNYRSTPAILRIANQVILKNNERHAKVLRSDPAAELGPLPEVVAFEDEGEEAEQVAAEIQEKTRAGYRWKDIAILYRSNSQGALLEAELRKNEIGYHITGGTAFFDRKETRDILAFLRSSLKPTEVSLRRILNVPARGIGEKTVDELARYAEEQGVTFHKALKQWKQAGLEDRTGAHIEDFLKLIESFAPTVLNVGLGGTCGSRLLQTLQAMGYQTHVQKHSPDALAAAKRWKMVEIFAGILDKFMERGGDNALRSFLDAMELRDNLEEKTAEENRVQLLTLHACKGLEYPVVFLVGVEEDILPHKTLGSDLAEERRLFYVGVTRAKKELILTRAKKRKRHGKLIDSPPSRFLLEIPKEMLTERSGPRPVSKEFRKALLEELYKKLESPSREGAPS